MPRWNTPKPTQAAVMAILIAATGAALTWLAQATAPGRGAGEHEPPAPPAAAPPRDAAGPVTTGPDLVDAEPAAPAPPARTTPWRLIDARTYSLTPATIPLYARLPGAYEWPLPAIDRLELLCFHQPDGPAHLGIMQTADGRLYHWGEERRFLQEHLDADSIDSREIRTVANPGAFMQPLRAAAHAACQRSLRGADTPDGPG